MHTLTRGGLFRRSQNFVDVALGAHQGRIAELHNSLGHLPNTPVFPGDAAPGNTAVALVALVA